MKRSLVLMAVVAMLAALAVVPPASATHSAPVNISVSSAYAGVCGSKPGAPVGVPAIWSSSLTANGLLTAPFKIPADVKVGSPVGSQAGVCTFTLATDPVWGAVRGTRGIAGCNATAVTACKGLHLPTFGAPARPGRFLQYAAGGAPQTATNICNFVSSSGTNGTCTQLATGYVDPGKSGLGGYCGSSQGFFWGLAGNSTLTLASRIYSIGQWTPNSAGTILPLSGSTTGVNWGAKPGHYTGWSGTMGNRTINPGGAGLNMFGLASARSYVGGVDSTPVAPGSCAGAPNGGALQFLSQQVLIALGN